MKTVSFLMGMVLLLPGCASTTNWELEHLVVAEASGLDTWQLLRYDNFKNNGGFARYYVPPGEKEKMTWSELITVGFLSGNKISIKDYLKANENRMKVRCPGARHQVIESDTHNVYYTDTYPRCDGRESQSEISRFIQGNDGIHSLSYTVKGRELTTGEKEKWLTILRNSFIAKGEKHEKVR
jgi:hypothetical protein